MSLIPFIHRVCEAQHLSRAEALAAMEIILGGNASPAQIAALLVGLRMKGETVEELIGFASAMRRMAAPVEVGLAGETLLDTCGTGGDGSATFNVSTIAAFVVAGAGVRVAKHGNRSISSRCGSARAIREVGIGFLFAPAIHPAMRHAQPVRLDLRLRTVFNLLGPLTNPAGATAQVVGAPTPAAAELMAGALAGLGLPRGFVVHGSDGMDEITTTGPTLAFEVRCGAVERRTLVPADFGVPEASECELKGGDPPVNRDIALEVLGGAPGPRRDIVVANAAAGLVASGRAPVFREAAVIAAASIDSGAARRKLDDLARFTASWSGA